MDRQACRRSYGRRASSEAAPAGEVSTNWRASAQARRYEIRFSAAARRAIAQRLPKPLLPLCWSSAMPRVGAQPQRVDCLGPLAGCYGCATYRIVTGSTSSSRIAHVQNIHHCLKQPQPVPAPNRAPSCQYVPKWRSSQSCHRCTACNHTPSTIQALEHDMHQLKVNLGARPSMDYSPLVIPVK